MAMYENITIEKGMYGVRGKSMTQVLEQLDPTENYNGTPLSGLDAFQRQLKRFDIKVSGANSDAVEKFFQSSSSSALFPEYVSRAVRQGMEAADVLRTSRRPSQRLTEWITAVLFLRRRRTTKA